MGSSVDVAAFARHCAALSRQIPKLNHVLEYNHPNVDLALTFPMQPGLQFAIHVSVQDDELHLEVGESHFSWFPCGQDEMVRACLQAVEGLLSGRWRMLEHWRGNKIIKAQLQQPRGATWETIATWSRWRLPLPFTIQTRVLQNTGSV